MPRQRLRPVMLTFRIVQIDKYLECMIEINPDAEAIAIARDTE